jgi:FAD/FMN-containing dehydrogenase
MSDTLLAGLASRLGPRGLLTGSDAASAGWSSLGRPIAIARPSSVEEVVAVIRMCAEAGVPVVPWGGKTGLVGGANADGAVALTLERMNRILQVAPDDGVMIVEAGCVVQTACEAAEAQGMFLPLDLGSRGSATIGGVISTNAGGNRVLRFGMMRDMVLGLEAVLADGSVVSSLTPLIKNNTGYDLKQLFIGSEGTLGVVTKAVLRLRPHLPSHNVALVAIDAFADVIRLMRRLESRLGGQLSAFEVMWKDYYRLVTTAPARGRPIVPLGHEYYVVIEMLGGDPAGDPGRFQAVLAETLEGGLIQDAVVAQSRAEGAAIWALRDDGEQVQRDGPIAAFDVSLRLSRVEPFSQALRERLHARWPQSRVILFGHIGDGNIHIVVGVDPERADMRRQLDEAVFGLLAEHEGSVSAEHGIGVDKRPYLALSRSPVELDLMRRLKQSLDPGGVLNPGKVIAEA